MTTTPNLNSFDMSTMVGYVDLTNFGSFCQEAMLDPDSAENVAAGTPVSLGKRSENLPTVWGFKEITDPFFGIAVFDCFRPTILPGNALTVARQNAVIYVQNGDFDVFAGEDMVFDVNSKTYVEYDEATGGTIVGTTIESAPAGALVRLQVSDGKLPYALPTASGATLGGIKVGAGLSIDGNGTLSVD